MRGGRPAGARETRRPRRSIPNNRALLATVLYDRSQYVSTSVRQRTAKIYLNLSARKYELELDRSYSIT